MHKLQFSRRIQHTPPAISITPLIDIVFLLLVFFILTSSLKQNEQLAFKLPEVKHGENSKISGITISLRSDNTLYINNEAVSDENFDNKLKSLLQDTQKTVRLKSEADVVVERLVQVMDRVKSNGAKEIALITKKRS